MERSLWSSFTTMTLCPSATTSVTTMLSHPFCPCTSCPLCPWHPVHCVHVWSVHCVLFHSLCHFTVSLRHICCHPMQWSPTCISIPSWPHHLPVQATLSLIFWHLSATHSDTHPPHVFSLHYVISIIHNTWCYKCHQIMLSRCSLFTVVIYIYWTNNHNHLSHHLKSIFQWIPIFSRCLLSADTILNIPWGNHHTQMTHTIRISVNLDAGAYFLII